MPRIIADWQVMIPPDLDHITTLLCTDLGYQVPVYFGTMYEADDMTEVHYANAQMAVSFDTENNEVKLRFICLSRNNRKDLIHELIHVVLRVHYGMVFKERGALPINYEEYLCEYYSHLLCGFDEEDAHKRARFYVFATGYDLFPIGYEYNRHVMKGKVLIEANSFFQDLQEVCQRYNKKFSPAMLQRIYSRSSKISYPKSRLWSFIWGISRPG